ncbi:hypothetical protein NEOLEDRAFT_957169 [Neolentinus lepideus HHB14362 ss-1]|uniref:Uncharacterized protein n=1 Tax=Neolentinus lepideus HHB14362 ss-1 TaxID=1314782 RepID=A0A165UFH6_9AGAM|nr:hypothetical protein NEOLEDRAFT_957169 [Neolentinus lepideus HHB14362 ss-1]
MSATSLTIRILALLLAYALLPLAVNAQAGSQHFSHNINAVVPNETVGGNYVCRPFGRCEPCPEDALHEPFCQPFGNRRLMHCSNATQVSVTAMATHTTSYYDHGQQLQGETPAWQSCGRIPEQERADFYEFVACNLAFALVALGLVAVRTKRMEAIVARRIAARIGLVRGGG